MKINVSKVFNPHTAKLIGLSHHAIIYSIILLVRQTSPMLNQCWIPTFLFHMTAGTLCITHPFSVFSVNFLTVTFLFAPMTNEV